MCHWLHTTNGGVSYHCNFFCTSLVQKKFQWYATPSNPSGARGAYARGVSLPLQGRAPACKRGCELREAARQGDGDQQPRGVAACGCLSRRALSRPAGAFASRPVARNAHPRLHAGAHTESRTEQLSIRVQATHGHHTVPGPFQCRRRFPGCGRHQPPHRRTTRGPLRRRVPAVLRGGCSKHPLSMLPKSQGQQTSGQAVLLATSGSGRRHCQTLSERLAAHLQTLSERPPVSCPGPV